MKWLKGGVAETIAEVVEDHFNLPVSEIMKHKENDFTEAEIMADYLIDVVEKPYIVGDYDADGITSSVILSSLIRSIGKECEVYIPRRFTDGYGLNPRIVKDIPEGFDSLVTVDNGIAAKNAIDGCDLDTYIIDHHLAPLGELPNAKFIFDPEAIPKNHEFTHYCAAGLCLKIAQVFLDKDLISHKLYRRLLILSGIATIADVMPLVNENRLIVADMLRIGQTEWTKLFECFGITGSFPTAKDVAFKIAPIINATGRLYDQGGQTVYNIIMKALFEDEYDFKMLIDNNEERKSYQNVFVTKAINRYDDSQGIIVQHIKGLPEGLTGIVAGKLAEKFHKPAIVFTDDQTKTFYKGSARSYGEFHIKNFLDKNADLFIKYGGHQGAAGMSLYEAEYKKLLDVVKDVKIPASDILYYDLDLDPTNIEKAIGELMPFAPYGEGNPEVVFHTKVSSLSKKDIGLNGVKFNCDGFDVVSFDAREKAEKIEPGDTFEVIGTLSLNEFRGEITPQIEVIDLKPIINKEQKKGDETPTFLL